MNRLITQLLPMLLLGLACSQVWAAMDQQGSQQSTAGEDGISSSDFESPPPAPGSKLDKQAEPTYQPKAIQKVTGTENTLQDGEAGGEIEDECDWELEGQPLQEQSQEVIYGISCHSFRWFDGLWGDKADFPEDQVNGLLLLGFEYREYDGFDPRGRFRVRAPLPNLSSRWDLIVGRENEEEFVSDTAPSESTLYNPGLSQDEDNEWLLGLGHRKKNRRKGFDYSVGLRLGAPPNLYGKVQYYYNKQYTEKTDLRFRQTLFWRTDEGLGTTTRANLVHQANPKDVIRWEGVATVSEDTEGMKWYAAQTWYHQLRGKNAISLQAFAQGETDEEVALRDLGLNLLWRQPFTRDWIFLSMGPNITWPQTFESEKREMSLGFSLWVEMEFGDYRY